MSNNGDLPPGWADVNLGDVVTPSAVKIEPGDAKNAFYLSLEHIQSNTNRILGRGTSADVKSTKSVFKAGDVLYGKLRPYLNKVCIPDFDGVCSTDILVFPESPAALNRFLLQFLSQQRVVEFATQSANGINLPRTSFEKLSELPIHLPPPAEQSRIVAKIEALQARSRRAREALEAIPPLLEQFRQSVLAAAFRGDLTADWRATHPDTEPASELLKRIRIERRRKWEEDQLAKFKAKGKVPADDKWKEKYEEPAPADASDLPDLPPSWCWCRAAEVCRFVTKGTTPPSGEMSSLGEIPFIKVYNLGFDGYLHFDIEPTFIPKRIHRSGTYARSRIRPNDVLMNLVGPPLGKVAVVPDSHPEWNCNQAIAIYSPLGGLDPWFIAFTLLHTRTLEMVIHGAKATAGQHNLTLEMARNVIFALPPADEQKQIVAHLRATTGTISGLFDSMINSIISLEHLDQSILAKAFRGELVSQDPNDEPASVLLERIRAQREADHENNGGSTRQRRGRRSTREAGDNDYDTATAVADDDEPAPAARRTPTARQRATAAATEPSPPPIHEKDHSEILAAIREVFSTGGIRSRDEAIHEIAQALGYQRVGSRIDEALDDDIRTAVRRGILENTAQGLEMLCRSITDYKTEFLIEQLLAGMGKVWWEREDLIFGTARYLGFRKTGPVIRKTLKSAINGAIRRGLLEYEDSRVRRLT